MKSRLLTVLLLLFLGKASCLAQHIFKVSWGDSDKPKSQEFRSFSQAEPANFLADSIAAHFQNQGYLDGYFLEENRSDTLLFRWVPRTLFRWGEIKIETALNSFLTQLGQPDLTYQGPYQWIEKGLEIAENNGFPFAELKIDSLEIKGELLFGLIAYTSGPRITWDSVEVAGETKTKATYVQQISGLNLGEPFSQRHLEQAAQTLRRSPYFTLIGTPELSFQRQQASPIFSIQDRRVNVFDGVVGFLPNENEPGKLLVTGEVDLRLYHLGGKGRDFSMQWQRLNIQSQSLEIRAKEAFIFRTPLDLQVGFALLKQDSSFVNRTFELDFGYRFSDDGYLDFFTRRQAGDLISSEVAGAEPILPEAIDYRWNQYGIGIDWDRLDSPVSPRKGVRLRGQFSLGNKRILENTGLPEEVYAGLEEASPQYQGWFSGEKHLYFKPVWGMWIRGVGGFLENANLFLNELYRVGGLKSIRGFNEKNFYAKRYGYVNLEQRLFFDQNSYFVVFVDAGIIENPFETQKIDRPFSFGTGINLDTVGGLFSFVFALGKSNTQPMSFSYSRIHFGYLARF